MVLDRLAVGLPLWPALAVLSALVMAVQLPGTHATAWHFFHDSARLLIGDASPARRGRSGLG